MASRSPTTTRVVAGGLGAADCQAYRDQLAIELRDEALARYSLVNIKVLVGRYLVKHAHTIFYEPFNLLEDKKLGVPARMRKIATIKRLIGEAKWYDGYSMELSKACLQGLHYLEIYGRLLIRAAPRRPYRNPVPLTCEVFGDSEGATVAGTSDVCLQCGHLRSFCSLKWTVWRLSPEI